MSVAAQERIEAPTWSVRWIGDRLSGLALHVGLIGLTIAWIVPTLGLFVSSFRHLSDISNTGWWTALSPPFAFTLENYDKVLHQGNLGTSFINSFMITIPATIIPAALAAFAAYAFSWMKFPGRDVIFLALVGLLAVPLQLTFIPVLKMFNAAGLSGTFLGIWLAHTGYGLPFAIYLLANFFRALPSDLFESAEMDGAGTLTVSGQTITVASLTLAAGNTFTITNTAGVVARTCTGTTGGCVGGNW